MQHQMWTRNAGRQFLTVLVAGSRSGTMEAESRSAIATAMGIVEAAGLANRNLARSRIWARDAAARQAASDIRKEMFCGDIRAASASFIAPARLPAEATMMIEMSVLVPTAADPAKTIREYDPPIVPPMFVSFDGMVFFSGDTNKKPGLSTQLANIRSDLDRFMEIAGTDWGRTTEVSVFLAASEAGAAGRDAVLANLPKLSCPLSIAVVEGFSAPEKRVEIEVSARA